MKKKVKIPNEGNGFKKLGIPYAPILKFGYPVVFDDDDNGDDSEECSPPVRGTSFIDPFTRISSNLYKVDYDNRIIDINGQIDERCFIYAKMIENWNRIDRRAFELKQRVNELIEENDEIRPVFEGFNLEDDDSKDALTKAQQQVEALIEKYPEILSIIVELQALKISQYKITSYEPKPIKIKFNSPGGWILAYQTLADVISLSKTKVIGINMGMAYSAAAFLLVACHERLALPKSRMMIHRGSGGNFGTFEQTESSQKNYKEQVDDMIDTFRERTKIPMKVLKKNMNPDWYLSDLLALKYWMIDRIVTDINEII